MSNVTNQNKDAMEWYKSGKQNIFNEQLAEANRKMGGPNIPTLASVPGPKKEDGSSKAAEPASMYLAAQQEAYRRQAEALQQQYELQKQREAEARAKQEDAVQKARDALTNAAQSNYDSAVNLLQQGYDKNVGSVNTDTEKALQDAYISSMMQQRNLGQQLAAYGRSGGAAESTLLGLANAYGQQRGTLDNTRQQNLANLVQKLQENKANQLQTLNTNKANYEQNYQNQLADLAGASLERLLNYDANYTSGITSLEQQRAQALASIAQQQAAAQQNTAQQDATALQISLKNDVVRAANGEIPYSSIIGQGKNAYINLYGQEGYERIRDAAYLKENPNSRLR